MNRWEDAMSKLRILMLASGVAMLTAMAPAAAQQGQQQQMPMMGGMMGQGTGGMMGQGTGGMMGQGTGGMMGQGTGGMMGQGMQAGGMMGQGGMMGGCPMMGGMMGSGMGMGGQGMMGQGMPMMGGMMGSGMGVGGQGMMGCPWCGPGMMGSGYATPQPSVNLSANDVKAYLDRWVAGNPNIQVANVVEQDANTITADIVTKDKGGLVQRYTFDKRTGFYRPVQ
jgi:hypothetical protein